MANSSANMSRLLLESPTNIPQHMGMNIGHHQPNRGPYGESLSYQTRCIGPSNKSTSCHHTWQAGKLPVPKWWNANDAMLKRPEGTWKSWNAPTTNIHIQHRLSTHINRCFNPHFLWVKRSQMSLFHGFKRASRLPPAILLEIQGSVSGYPKKKHSVPHILCP